MSEPSVSAPITKVDLEHPAVLTWRSLGLGSTAPTRIEELSRTKQAFSAKSEIYRLYGVGLGGAPVIAKRARRPGMLIERYIYEDVLPLVPAPRLHYYGLVDEPTGEFSWLFVEEASGEVYSPSTAAHRTLATEWLGVLHAATAGLDLAARLPPIGPKRYLNYLRDARASIRMNLANPVLKEADISSLAAVMYQLDALEACWRAIEAFCGTMPKCLVHGDFIPKNVRVCGTGTRSILHAIDWEASGWGVPAEDIAGLDMAIYHSRVCAVWPQVGPAALQRLADLGSVFMYLAWIEATAPGLAYDWADSAAMELATYGSSLREARQSVGWLQSPTGVTR